MNFHNDFFSGSVVQLDDRQERACGLRPRQQTFDFIEGRWIWANGVRVF
jgi:hypothetical protein